LEEEGFFMRVRIISYRCMRVGRAAVTWLRGEELLRWGLES
jgi:hypothetical protein